MKYNDTDILIDDSLIKKIEEKKHRLDSLRPLPKDAVKKLLEDMGVEYYFGDVDLMTVAERTEAMQVVQKWNPGSSFPTMILDDNRCIIGFQENKIKEELSK